MKPTIVPETPLPSTSRDELWSSDAIARMLQALDVPWVALVPGASFRGLHDSLVNHLGNQHPQMLLCLHEQHAIAMAHGYAKASGRMMGAILHSNVGLLNGSMAIFNAWCDRVPMLILGATGPWDAAKRRPWIDWIHTSRDQGAYIRSIIKWDDQPTSPQALVESMTRANLATRSAPTAPVYICLDAGFQEQRLDKEPEWPEVSRFVPPEPSRPGRSAVEQAAALLARAERPVIMFGRGSRKPQLWQSRIRLAERLGACVMTDLKTGAMFPTDHPAHFCPPFNVLGKPARELFCEADVILALDWVDLAGTLKQIYADRPITAKIVSASCDVHLHRGFSMDYFGLPPVDVHLLVEPDVAVPLLLEACRARGQAPASVRASQPGRGASDVLSLRAVAAALNEATDGVDVCLTGLPLGWPGECRHFSHPLDYLGGNGGGGVGAGPGITVGAALALKGSGRVPIGLVGDGDYLMGVTALWTATHYHIPCLLVVCNNRSFYNDEAHQERVARMRGRPVENKWIGQRINEPDIDLAMLAVAQGAKGIGPVTSPEQLRSAIAQGVRAVMDGEVCVIDARVLPGYDADISGEKRAVERSAGRA